MNKKLMKFAAVMLLLLLSSCGIKADEHPVGTTINVLKVDKKITDEDIDELPEQPVKQENVVNQEEINEHIDENTEITVEPSIPDSNNVDFNEESTELPANDLIESEIENQQKEEDKKMNMTIKIGENTFNCTLYENETTLALIDQLPLSIMMDELNGNEKYYYLQNDLPANASRPNEIHAGELMLFGTDCLVLFYENFTSSYSYTPIGYVTEADQLVDVLGNGTVQIVFDIN